MKSDYKIDFLSLVGHRKEVLDPYLSSNYYSLDKKKGQYINLYKELEKVKSIMQTVSGSLGSALTNLQAGGFDDSGTLDRGVISSQQKNISVVISAVAPILSRIELELESIYGELKQEVRVAYAKYLKAQAEKIKERDKNVSIHNKKLPGAYILPK